MHFNLRLLNVFIGLCRGDPNLPRDLQALGYEDRAIEKQFRTQTGDTVHPEIVLSSAQERHSILLETKSGKNLDADQLQRYAGVTTEDLVQRVPVEPSAAESHDVALLGASEHETDLASQLETLGHQMPLLVATDTGIRLVANLFARDPISEVFAPELLIDWGSSPLGYVPVDGDSTDADVAEVVVPIIVAQMASCVAEVNTEQICVEICRTTWGSMGGPGKNAIKAKVKAALQTAASGELSPWLEFRPQGNGSVSIRNNPYRAAPRDRTNGLQQLQQRQTHLLDRLRAGQLSLFP